MRIGAFIVVTVLYIAFFGKSDATIDLKNVDLSKFQYFKDKIEEQMMAKAQQTMQLLAPLTDKIEKVKAVGTYFRNVFLGNPDHNTRTSIVFDPHHGEAYRPYYEQQYGPRGEHLIEALGHGPPPKQVHEHIAHYEHPGY